MSQLRKWLSAALAALVLAAPFMTTAAVRADVLAPASPHGGSPVCRGGTWATFEIQLGFTNRATGQTWNEGFTYSRWMDCYGRIVKDESPPIFAHIRDMDAQGWTWTYSSGDKVIAQGRW